MWRVASGHRSAASKLPGGFLPIRASQQRRNIMQTSPEPWIGALRHSHDRLQALGGPLGQDQLEQRSYASEWAIAQALSHLGSGAEIFGLFLKAGLAGQDSPGREAFGPIWNTWNAEDPPGHAADGLRADRATAERFESVSARTQ